MTFKKIVLLSCLCFSGLMFGMTYDNRFFPLLDKPTLHQDDENFFARVQPFYMFASQSYNAEGSDRPLFDVFGHYDQNQMNKALQDSGLATSSLMPSFMPKNALVPWSMVGKMDAAGLAFRWYYSLTNFMDIGGSFFFAGSRSRQQCLFDESNFKFLLPNGTYYTLNLQQVQQLYDAQDEMLKLDSVNGLLKDSFGISDLDFYVRFGFMRHFFLKFRTFDLGTKIGVIAPTASGFDLDAPSSLIFGGNKHWGMYFDASLDTELKEDLFAGLNMRFIQRFARTDEIRAPLLHIPNNLGILQQNDGIGKGWQARVTPGFTFVFSPYGGVANLRDGFGLQVGYTLILHTSDTFRINADAHTNYPDKNWAYPETDASVLKTLSERSKWGSEYITCSAIYDFAKDKECRGATPCVKLDIDIPISVVVAQQSFKTYGISLRIESDLW